MLTDVHSERATALMMVPATLLVLIALGAIAVDTALVHAAQRSAYRSVSAAADDAAAMLDEQRLQIDGAVVLDPDAAERVALAHLGVMSGAGIAPMGQPAHRVLSTDVRVDPVQQTVTVIATVEVRHVFLGALPGTDSNTEVTVQATGRMLQ